MTDLRTSRFRYRAERTQGAKLTAYGSENVVEQGFAQQDILDALRYDFGAVPSYGRFGGLGAPNLSVVPFEFSIDAYTNNTKQYIVDSDNGSTFIRLEEDNSITLSIDNVKHTWSPIQKIIDSESIGINFDWVGNNILMSWYLEDGTLTPHPDGAKDFSGATSFGIDTISTLEAQPYIFFNGTNTHVNRNSGDINWRGQGTAYAPVSYVEFKTADLRISNDWMTFFGVNDTSGQDNDTHCSVRRHTDGNIHVAMRWRATFGSGIPQMNLFFEDTAINWEIENQWRIERRSEELVLFVNGSPVASTALPLDDTYADMRINRIGWAAPWEDTFNGGTVTDPYLHGYMYDFVCSGTLDPIQETYVPMNEGSGTVINASGQQGTNWTLQNGSWVSPRKGFTGHIYELFLGEWHWTMPSIQEFNDKQNFFAEDAQESNRPINIVNFDVNSYVDIGEGSLIYHVEDDAGLGAAFVMEDNSTTRAPKLSAPFTELQNTLWDTHGGGFRINHRYSSVLPNVGDINGGFSLTWDKTWDGDVIPYELILDGSTNAIRSSSVLGVQNKDLEISWEMHNLDATGCNPIFAADSPTVLTGAYIYQGNFWLLNNGGFNGSVPSGTPTYTLSLNEGGNYKFEMQYDFNNGGATPLNLRVTDLDTGIVSNHNSTNHQGNFGNLRWIGYSPSNVVNADIPWSSVNPDYTTGVIKNFLLRSTGNSLNTWDIPMDDGTGNTLVNNGSSPATFDIQGTANWQLTENQFEGVVLLTETTSSGTQIRILNSIGTDHLIPIPNEGNYHTVSGGYDPETLTFYILLDGVLVLSTQEFITDDATYCYDASVKSFCGNGSGLGAVKHVKLVESITFEDPSIIQISASDVQDSFIYHLTGLRDITFELLRADELGAGSQITWQSELPHNVTVKREDDESFVLVDFGGKPVQYLNVTGGEIVCGNEASVGANTLFLTGAQSN